MGYFSSDRRHYRRLVSAIGRNDMEHLKKLFPMSPNSLRKPEGEKDGHSLLFAAARENFVEGIEYLLAQGADVEGNGDDKYRTPLQQAAYMKHEEAVLALLKGGANINALMPDKDTALIEAQQYGHEKMFALLLDHGANPNAQKSDGQTALHYAAKLGRSNMVKLLLDKGVDITIVDNHMNTAADVAAKEYPGIADLIRAHGSAQKPAEPPAAGWQLTAADEVARVSVKAGIGYRVTEIFNFNARLYTQIARNLETGAESQAVKGFAELDDGGAVAAARTALAQLGGKLSDTTSLDKKKLAAPGQGQGG